MNGYTYKVLSVLSTKQYNVAYVFLNGENLSQKEIASLEKRIIREYKNGTPFAELIKTYTMDGDPDMEADLWFSENQRLPEFIAAVEKQKPGDVYTLDIPGHKFHYVIKATAPPRISHTYAVFRMPQPLPKNSYSSN
jgi:parvulin-like peptidyl-prolyl isomerase